jgi:hypothetical protein
MNGLLSALKVESGDVLRATAACSSLQLKQIVLNRGLLRP